MILGYLDAGTGSLIAQILAGGIAGVAVFVKYRWHTIRGWFRRGDSPKS
ncbi:MAG: hypothetical protein ACRDWS_08905 [Acidimicrobiia bacterium]